MINQTALLRVQHHYITRKTLLQKAASKYYILQLLYNTKGTQLWLAKCVLIDALQSLMLWVMTFPTFTVFICIHSFFLVFSHSYRNTLNIIFIFPAILKPCISGALWSNQALSSPRFELGKYAEFFLCRAFSRKYLHLIKSQICLIGLLLNLLMQCNLAVTTVLSSLLLQFKNYYRNDCFSFSFFNT